MCTGLTRASLGGDCPLLGPSPIQVCAPVCAPVDALSYPSLEVVISTRVCAHGSGQHFLQFGSKASRPIPVARGPHLW